MTYFYSIRAVLDDGQQITHAGEGGDHPWVKLPDRGRKEEKEQAATTATISHTVQGLCHPFTATTIHSCPVQGLKYTKTRGEHRIS